MNEGLIVYGWGLTIVASIGLAGLLLSTCFEAPKFRLTFSRSGSLLFLAGMLAKGLCQILARDVDTLNRGAVASLTVIFVGLVLRVIGLVAEKKVVPPPQ